MKKLAIFGSGKGSNAENIIEYFKGNKEIEISLIVSNIKEAGILDIAVRNKIPRLVITKSELKNESEKLLAMIAKYEIDYIILAGFLLLIPEKINEAFQDRIINIHPSILPNYGGKGMYGMYVHEAVIIKKETQSGISIHLVNNEYDKGEILFQAICPIDKNDDALMLAQKIHELEFRYFPKVIEDYINQKK